MKKTYNGWSNYETWVYALYLYNEQWSYDETRMLAKTEFERAVADKYMSKREAAIAYLAEVLQNNAETASYELIQIKGVFRDLLDAAVSEINFYEIAKSLIDELYPL